MSSEPTPPHELFPPSRLGSFAKEPRNPPARPRNGPISARNRGRATSFAPRVGIGVSRRILARSSAPSAGGSNGVRFLAAPQQEMAAAGVAGEAGPLPEVRPGSAARRKRSRLLRTVRAARSSSAGRIAASP